MMNASLKMQAPGTGGRLQQVPMNPSPLVGPLHLPVDEEFSDEPEISSLPPRMPTASWPVDPLPPVVSVAPVSVAPVQKVDESAGVVVSEPVAPIVPAVSPPPMSVPSSAVPHKEGGPVSTDAQVVESSKPAEIMQPTEPEVMVAPELKEIVIPAPEAKPLVVDPVMKKAGATLTGEAVPVAKAPTGAVKLPMSYADAVATEKRTKFRDALHWFARYIEYQWRKLDPTIGKGN